jgi:hypothetical protein
MIADVREADADAVGPVEVLEICGVARGAVGEV